ncbi:helix-turn-helix transcriptional regulator [Candidatus Saccharibacteria bacterium]|nr:helix-turn-helix transcriptional regulator [Candidatus Saccharibacteria bacterium]
MQYSEMLKEVLAESHWTQEQLAAKLGVSFATVNSWINGRTTPQKSLIPEIRKLYLAQDVTNEPEPVYITLVDLMGTGSALKVGDYVVLRKDCGSEFDDETIRAYVDGVDEGGCQYAFVANSVRTVVRGTRSAGRIYDKFDVAARAQIMFTYKSLAIARVVSWRAEDEAR